MIEEDRATDLVTKPGTRHHQYFKNAAGDQIEVTQQHPNGSVTARISDGTLHRYKRCTVLVYDIPEPEPEPEKEKEPSWAVVVQSREDGVNVVYANIPVKSLAGAAILIGDGSAHWAELRPRVTVSIEPRP